MSYIIWNNEEQSFSTIMIFIIICIITIFSCWRMLYMSGNKNF